MSNEQWNEHEVDPWDRETYQTGSTTPPKNHGGAIALILSLTILLCCAVTTLALMKVQLFPAQEDPQADVPPVNIQIIDGNTLSTTEATQEPGLSLDPEPSVGPHVDTTLATQPGEEARSGLDVAESPLSLDNAPQPEGMSLQDIYEKNIPSVVSISCTFRGGSSTGTGVILTADGYIVTNAHVVESAETIQVLLTGGETLDAALVGADTVSDLAVLWVDREDLIPAELGSAQSLRVGDVVVAIGDPLGISLRGTMTDGIISGINRDIAVDGRTMTLIQTNAALNEGNSGGPLINCYGQVIGINTMKIGDAMSASGVEGLGFAIPSETVRDIVNQLIGQGYVSGRPDLGIEGTTVTTRQQWYGLPSGLLITALDQDSDAYAQGIRVDDVLMAVGDTRIYSLEDYQTALYACEVGQEISLVIYRNGRQYQLTVTVGEYGA